MLLLVVSETGLVYTFTTAKLQPLVTQPEGKNLIQACLNAPHGQLPSSMPVGTPINRTSMPVPQQPNVPGGLSIGSGSGAKEDESADNDDASPGDATRGGPPRKRRRASSTTAPPRGNTSPQVSAGVPPPGAPSASPTARPGAIPPGAPPLSIPGVPGQMPIEHSPRQQVAQPTSPNYAQPGGGYPPQPTGGDPNLYAQHGGYPGAPQQPYGGYGHDAAAPAQNPWAPPPVHGGQYARR